MESEKYPFFAVMWHPEKVGKVFYDHETYGLDHSLESIKINRYFADWFV